MMASQTGTRNGRILVSATNSTHDILDKKRLTTPDPDAIINI